MRWLSLLLLVLPAPAWAAEGAWPFGKGAGPMRGGDYYNLGLLGAKARDADAAPVAPMTQGRRQGDPSKGGNDDGPLALFVELLYPDGPAQKAGIEVGDVIVGVGRRPFQEPCLAAVADALRKAESGKGLVTLLVRRGGKGKATKVQVTIPVGGKPMRKPTSEPARKKMFDAALAWLAERQQGTGGFPATLSGVNGSVVQASVAGLAWLAGGSNLKGGPYQDHVRRAADFVIARAGKQSPGMAGRGGSNWNQTNWGVAHAAIFLGELHGHSPDDGIRDALVALGADLVKRQEKSGGWAHAPGGPNALGYVELNIVSGLALSGIGLATQAGYDAPEEALTLAEAYLQASSGGDGGIGYSDKSGQKGQGNIGRTACCWLGYLTLGKAKDGWAQKMKKWVGRNAGNVFGGHASLMQHVFLAAVAAQAAGKKSASAYWQAVERDLTLARAPDGSLQPRPWHESLSLSSNSDVTFGEVWTTAAWAIALGCMPEKKGRPGLPYWMGMKFGVPTSTAR